MSAANVGGWIGLVAGVGALVKVLLDGRRTLRTDAIAELYDLIDKLKIARKSDRDEYDGENRRLRDELKGMGDRHKECETNLNREQRRSDRQDAQIRMLTEALRSHNIEIRPWTLPPPEGEGK